MFFKTQEFKVILRTIQIPGESQIKGLCSIRWISGKTIFRLLSECRGYTLPRVQISLSPPIPGDSGAEDIKFSALFLFQWSQKWSQFDSFDEISPLIPPCHFSDNLK